MPIENFSSSLNEAAVDPDYTKLLVSCRKEQVKFDNACESFSNFMDDDVLNLLYSYRKVFDHNLGGRDNHEYEYTNESGSVILRIVTSEAGDEHIAITIGSAGQN